MEYKPMSTPFLMLAKSAMPDKMKRNCLVQEAIRLLRNTKRELPRKQNADIHSEFSNKLMLSGYSEKFCLEIIQSAIMKTSVRLQIEESGLFTEKENFREEER